MKTAKKDKIEKTEKQGGFSKARTQGAGSAATAKLPGNPFKTTAWDRFILIIN